MQSFAFAASYVHKRSWFESGVDGQSFLGQLPCFLSLFVCLLIIIFIRFIHDHFADSFRLLQESPPRYGMHEEKWISSATLLEAPAFKSPPLPPRTPEPKVPFVPSFSLLTPSGQSPQSIRSSPSTKGSPLTPLQFMRRAEPDSSLLRPVTPSKAPQRNKNTNNTHTPARNSVWRP